MSSDDLQKAVQDFIAKHDGRRTQAENAAGTMIKSAKTDQERQYWGSIWRELRKSRPPQNRPPPNPKV